MTKAEEYITKTMKVGNVTISIHQPILSIQEKTKRTEEIISALGRYGVAVAKLSEY